MTVMWLIDLHGRAGSKYLAIADAISESVADGSLTAGAKLPIDVPYSAFSRPF